MENLKETVESLTAGSVIEDYVGDEYRVVSVDNDALALQLQDPHDPKLAFWVPMLELMRGFQVKKIASVPTTADDKKEDKKPTKKDAPKKPTEYKELSIRPREVSPEDVQNAATPDAAMMDAYKKLKASQNELQELSRLLADIRTKFDAAVRKAEEEGERLQEESKFKQAIDELGLLISQSQNRVVNFGDRIVAYVKEVKKGKGANPSDSWKLEKLLSRYGTEAAKYLEAAERGLRAQSDDVTIQKLIEFELKPHSAKPPRPEAALGTGDLPKMASDVSDLIENAFNNVKHFLYETSKAMRDLDEYMGEDSAEAGAED